MLKSKVANLAVVAGVVFVVAAVAFVRSTRMGAGNPSAADEQAAATSADLAESEPPAAPSALPKMLDLGSDQCIPCKQMAPILAELRASYAGRAEIVFIDVWKNPDAGKAYGVRIIPTQIFFDREGKEVWRHEGFLPREEIVARLQALGVG